MRTFAALFLTAAALFAGCLSDDSSADGDGSQDDWTARGPTFADGTPAPSFMDYTDCTEQLGVFPVPAEAMGVTLPEGFVAAPFDEAGVAVTTLAVGYECMVGNETVAEFGGGLVVIPPAEYADANITQYAVVLAWVTNREASSEVYQAWGANGTHTFDDVEFGFASPENPLVRVGQVRGTNDLGSVTMESIVPQAGQGEAPGAIRLFLVDWTTMEVASVFDVSWTASAYGSGQGTGILNFETGVMGLLPMPNPGIAFHFWGVYDYHLEYNPMV